MKLPNLKYLCADSRSVVNPSETLFAAIKTPLADGHRFIEPLLRRGVRNFIVEYVPQALASTDANFIVVPSVVGALGEIARERLGGVDGGVLITGSHGKTTLKELLYRTLLGEKKVRRSPRSWNSSVGLPLAVWDMTITPADSAVLITEAGIDGPGQARIISNIIGTSHGTGVITPLTAEHDSAFESHTAKVLEKIHLVSGCRNIFYAAGDAELETLLARELPNAQLRAVEQGDYPTIYHALAAAVARSLGASEEALGRLMSLPVVNKRRQIAEGSFNNTIYRDFFTPDIRSLQDALDFMRRHTTPAREKVLLLGDLLEGNFDRARELALQMGVDRVESISEELLANIHTGKEVNHAQVLLFGCDSPLMTDIAEALESAGHDTTLEVDLDAVVHNFNYYRSLVPAGTGIVAMVKASAYGMGAIEIGMAMQSAGAASLAVAVIEEGIALREAGITMPVMVLNPVTNRYPALFAHHLEPAVFSPEELERMIKEAGKCGVKNYPVHIKLDTGMHRVGFIASQLDRIVELLNSTDAVRAASIFSHLATADCLDKDDYTLGQIASFTAMADTLREKLGTDVSRHILNTAGMMRFANACNYEMSRLGIGLYGLEPYRGGAAGALRPVAAFRSHIISLKHWPADTPIGYGCNGHTKGADSIIATVPVGYADGIDRRLGRGNASFVVRGVECPTIGVICMDLCMIDVTAVPGVAVGDTVEIFGPQIPVERISDTLGTISYEILTSVAPRVKRVYIKH